jgi:cytoskeleton-associated protein 5
LRPHDDNLLPAQYGDDVYELLSASFDDPSATIVYPYVYRILNSSNKVANDDAVSRRNGNGVETTKSASPEPSRPLSPPETASSVHSTQSSFESQDECKLIICAWCNSFTTQAEEPDPDAQLLVIIGHISSETTGALHKEGITELHQFLKAHPHKRARVEKMLESTGAAFRKYINRALASRAAEDKERTLAVADTLSSKHSLLTLEHHKSYTAKN